MQRPSDFGFQQQQEHPKSQQLNLAVFLAFLPTLHRRRMQWLREGLEDLGNTTAANTSKCACGGVAEGGLLHDG